MQEEYYTVNGYPHTGPDSGLTPALEDYLEMICRQMDQAGHVRVGGLAAKLHVTPSAASRMVAKLAKEELLAYEKYGVIALTEKGKRLGEYLIWRHKTLCAFFSLLGGGEEFSLKEVELIEHILSAKTVARMGRLAAFLGQDPQCAGVLRQPLPPEACPRPGDAV